MGSQVKKAGRGQGGNVLWTRKLFRSGSARGGMEVAAAAIGRFREMYPVDARWAGWTRPLPGYITAEAAENRARAEARNRLRIADCGLRIADSLGRSPRREAEPAGDASIPLGNIIAEAIILPPCSAELLSLQHLPVT